MNPEDICQSLSYGCFVVAGLLLCMIARDWFRNKRKPPTGRKCPPFLSQNQPK